MTTTLLPPPHSPNVGSALSEHFVLSPLSLSVDGPTQRQCKQEAKSGGCKHRANNTVSWPSQESRKRTKLKPKQGLFPELQSIRLSQTTQTPPTWLLPPMRDLLLQLQLVSSSPEKYRSGSALMHHSDPAGFTGFPLPLPPSPDASTCS